MKKTKKTKKAKPRYAQGNLQEGAPLLAMAGETIEQLSPKPNPGSAALGGAAKGAAAGMALGPWGAAAGAVIGGVSGLIGGRKQQKAIQRAENAANRKAVISTMNTGAQTMPTFAEGGTLNPISPDAVEVQANNPSQTDSVELPNAFVDHNEIIDNQNRVFSDVLKAPSGRSIAKEAKRLEKMKNNNPRFGVANDMIESKLDNLFGYQERLNLAKNTKKLAKGGVIDPDDPKSVKAKVTGPTYVKPTPNLTPEQAAKANLGEAVRFKNLLTGSNKDLVPSAEYNQLLGMQPKQQVGGGSRDYTYVDPKAITKADSVITASRPLVFKKGLKKGGKLGYAEGGGPFDFINPFIQNEKPQGSAPVWDESMIAPAGSTRIDLQQAPATPQQSVSSSPTKGGGFNWQKAGTTAASFIPDLINVGLTGRLKAPKAPQMENSTFLNRINADDQLAENARQQANTNKLITKNTAQPANIASNLGATLAKRLYADNQTRGAVNRQNAEIGNQEAFLNQGVKARNTDRTNLHSLQKTDTRNRKLSAYSQIASNVGNKIQQMGREKNLQDLSLAELDVMKKKYQDSGVYDRNFEDIMTRLLERQGVKPKQRYGGKLGKNRRMC